MSQNRWFLSYHPKLINSIRIILEEERPDFSMVANNFLKIRKALRMIILKEGNKLYKVICFNMDSDQMIWWARRDTLSIKINWIILLVWKTWLSILLKQQESYWKHLSSTPWQTKPPLVMIFKLSSIKKSLL